jgi:hypothetical protein
MGALAPLDEQGVRVTLGAGRVPLRCSNRVTGSAYLACLVVAG